MSTTRSGLRYRGAYDENQGLAPALGSSVEWSTQQIINHIDGDFRAMAARSDFNTATGNIAALLAKFEGLEIFCQMSYSSSSSLRLDVQNQLDLAPITTNFTGDSSLQVNPQARNHTEPKLLQEFEDRFLFEGSPLRAKLKWVCIVTDRPACGSCRHYTIHPFAAEALFENWGFFVIDLGGQIQQAQWNPVRTPYNVRRT